MKKFTGNSLRMCLLFADTCWEALLDQEGLEWEHAPLRLQTLDNYPVVLIPKTIPADMIKVLKKYVLEGGSVLTIKDNQKIADGEIIKIMLPYSKRDYSKIWNENVKSNYYIKSDSKRNQLFYYKDKSSNIIFLPFNISNILNENSFKRKYFNTNDEPVGEYVSRYSKGNLRKVFSNLIKSLYCKKQLPFIKKWYYPGQFNSIFSFRIDVDDYFKPHFEALLNASKNYKNFMTWFICCSSFENHKNVLKKMKAEGFDIQSHGYFHFSSKKLQFSNWNLEMSKNFLNDLIGAESIKGYVSPGGVYYPGLRKVLMNQKFLYSSEFSLDYDNFPLYYNMDTANQSCGIIHIPVHPICYGSFHQNTDIKKDSEIISNYFRCVIDKKYHNYEPIILYGHPTNKLGANIGFYEKLMEIIPSYAKVWKTTLSEFSNWWNYRHHTKFKTEYDSLNNAVKVISNGGKSLSHAKHTLLFRVEYGDISERIPDNTLWKKPSFVATNAFEKCEGSPQIGDTVLLNKRKLLQKSHFYRRQYIYLVYLLMKKRKELYYQKEISRILTEN